MKSVQIIALFLAALFTVGSAYAQGLENKLSVKHPDLSGSWQLDRSRSVERESFIPPVFGLILTIKQDLFAVRFRMTAVLPPGVNEKIPEGEFTLFTDGRGDTYPDGMGKWATTTGWQGDKLISTSRNKVGLIVGYEQYELGADGRTLRWSSLRPDGTLDNAADQATYQKIDNN